MKIAFRFDDFTLNDSEFYTKLLVVFSKNKIPINLGVIPFDKSGNFIDSLSGQELKQLKKYISENLVEIAVHGYKHKNNLNDLKLYSEFKDVEYKIQNKWLKEGKQKLENYLNSKITTFIPPWNSYDVNTLRALEQNNFRCISGGNNLRSGPVHKGKIKYIPGTFEDLKELEKLINLHRNKNVYLIVLFHEYSFKGYGEDDSNKFSLKSLDNLLKKIKNDPSIQCATFSNLLNSKENFDGDFFQDNLKRNLIKDYFNIKNILLSKYYKLYLNTFNAFFHLGVFLILSYATYKILYLFNHLFYLTSVIGFAIFILYFFTKFNFVTPKRKLFAISTISVIFASTVRIIQIYLPF